MNVRPLLVRASRRMPALARIVRRVRPHRPQPDRGALVRAFAHAYPDAFFVVVGANDAVGSDHLRDTILDSEWSGLMIEPVPYVFERLRATWGHVTRVELACAAVGGRDGTLPFHHLREARPGEDLPAWYDQLGSFHREVILRHVDAIPDIADRIVTREVPTMTFRTMCEAHGIDRIDLLQIDTEGHDAEIVRQVDFDEFRPRLVIYEHHHLDDDTRRSTEELLHESGYHTRRIGMDTWCIDRRAAGPEDERWQAAWASIVGAPVSSAS